VSYTIDSHTPLALDVVHESYVTPVLPQATEELHVVVGLPWLSQYVESDWLACEQSLQLEQLYETPLLTLNSIDSHAPVDDVVVHSS